MSRLEMHLDAETLQPIIQAAVDAAVRRLQAERHTDDAGRILLTKVEAAKALAVSPATLDRLRRDAGLPAVKLDGLVLFRPASLDAWAAARETGGQCDDRDHRRSDDHTNRGAKTLKETTPTAVAGITL